MFVRVYDEETRRYYGSMVYARIGIMAFDGFIVFDPYEGAFVMKEHFEKSGKVPKAICRTVNTCTEGFVKRERAYMLKLRKYLGGMESERKLDMSTDYLLFYGYDDVLENAELVAKLLCGGKVSPAEAGIRLRGHEDSETWSYIATQKAADEFMELFCGFHDADIRKITYEETDFCPNVAAVYAVFESSWYGKVELCFEGVEELRLRPAGEAYTSGIYEATLLVNEERVFWADDYMEAENMNHGGCAVRALSLKWRTLEKLAQEE